MDETPKNVTIRVAVQRPIYNCLDYRCEPGLVPEPGCRVRVPLGNTRVTAIVIETHVNSRLRSLKKVIEILDKIPLIDASMLKLLSWASQYYMHPIGEVIFHALPTLLNKGRGLPTSNYWRLSSKGVAYNIDSLKRAPKQQALLMLLKQNNLNEIELKKEFGSNWRNIMRQLEKKELVRSKKVVLDYLPPKSAAMRGDSPARITVSKEQSDCITHINGNNQKNIYRPMLLHGVTGSGKTEVYLRVVEPLLHAGKQALVLVPEIGLTPQILARFKQYFSKHTIVLLHSALNDSERLQIWMGAKSGKIDIVIGTRSAVFTPMPNLGLIIIDEEHDPSYKQQEGFLYQARDLAVKRAYDAKIPILLGSATPSLESIHNVNRKRYQYLYLSQRPGSRQMPEMVIQDIRPLQLEAGISQLLLTEIRQHLENNHQVLIFLNRRGFAPVLLCSQCGWHAVCPKCDVGMTYHALSQKVSCHHCGLEQQVKQQCPDCGEQQLTTQGQGTERVEQVLSTYFPKTPVIRIDRDSTAKKGSLQEKLTEVQKGQPVILVGTQMLTKGHDFPKLTLVGILDVDQALFSVDFRAHERLAQQVVQVAGRAGRGKAKGRVVLQTSQPDHPLLLNLLSQGYYQTAQEILNERQVWNYPPYGAQALIRASATSQTISLEFLQQLRTWLSDANTSGVDLLGPMPSPLSKRANRYRYQLLLTATKRSALHQVLNQCLDYLTQSSKKANLRWKIDVDPSDFL